MTIPDPSTITIVLHGRQLHDRFGKETFYAIAGGRRPDVNDALLVMGKGSTRQSATVSAKTEWRKAYKALKNQPRLTKE